VKQAGRYSVKAQYSLGPPDYFGSNSSLRPHPPWAFSFGPVVFLRGNLQPVADHDR